MLFGVFVKEPPVIMGGLAALFVFSTMLTNVYALVPIRGNDGALIIESIFPNRTARRLAMLIAVTSLVAIFGFDTLLTPEGFMWYGLPLIAFHFIDRLMTAPPPTRQPATGGQQAALLVILALTVGLYAFEARQLAHTFDFARYLRHNTAT